jgi:hypothetical protein
LAKNAEMSKPDQPAAAVKMSRATYFVGTADLPQ